MGDVADFETFSGRWESFDITACPKGFLRAITADSGRVIEPITPDSCRVSMSLVLQLPSFIRWAVTDSLLCWAVNMASKSTMKSWDTIVDKWDSSGWNERIRDNA